MKLNIVRQKLQFPYSSTIAGFFLGIMAVVSVASALPESPNEPAIRYIDKEKIVKVPVKLDSRDNAQIQCLAENAYFEAGNQSTNGKIAVTNVVMNRVNDRRKRFGSTPCAVVSQKTGGTCQFSWKCERHKVIRSGEQYAASRKIAEQVYLGNYTDITNGAKYYHTAYVNPGWALKIVARIGAHIFYREG